MPLDSASAEPLHPQARETLLAALDAGYADPRRLHHDGRRARLLLDNAREAVAGALDVRPDEVTFTGSGTDAVHRGLLGLLGPRLRHGTAIAHGAVEHSSVLHAAAWASRTWPQVSVASLPVDRLGRLDLAAAPELLTSPPAVIAVQSANHEVGTRQPVAEAAALTDAPLFMDACASAGREPLPQGWAAAALSAHKWGGPAGVGVLLVRRGTRWRNPFPADDRIDERGVGFENVPGALAAAAALQAVVAEREEVGVRQRSLIEWVRRRVVETVPDVEVVGDQDDRLPHLVTFSCLYVDGEALVHELDAAGYGVASGSACTASTLEPSHVLAAMGVLTHGNIRLSLARDTSQAQVEGFLTALPGVVAGIRGRLGIGEA